MQVLKNETSALKKNIKVLMEEKSELENMIHSVLEEEEQAKRNIFGRKGRSKKKHDMNEPQTSAEKVHSHIESRLNRKQKTAKTKHGWPIRRRKVGVEW